MPEVVLDEALLMTETRWCSLHSPVSKSPSAHKDKSSILLSSCLVDESVELQLDSPPVLLREEALWPLPLWWLLWCCWSEERSSLPVVNGNWCVERQSRRRCRGTSSDGAVKDSFWVEPDQGQGTPRISNFFLCKILNWKTIKSLCNGPY